MNVTKPSTHVRTAALMWRQPPSAVRRAKLDRF